MQRHHRDSFRIAGLVGVHNERNVFQKSLQILELLHRAHQLLEIFEPSGGIGGAIPLPHFSVAGFVKHDLGELGMGQASRCGRQRSNAAMRSRSA